MPLPIGYDNFRELIENQLEFVDKSLLIEEIINDIATKAIVITRPCRFGKTLNLSMLHHFLSKEVNGHGITWYNQFLDHLLTGNIDLFEQELRDVMEQTVTSHDTSRNPEAFYHGLMVGLTASLYHNEHYEIQSNKESGYGRYDYLIFARDKNKPTLLLEFKKVSGVKDKGAEILDRQLEQAAQEAVSQIDKKHYVAEAKQRGSTSIIKIGLAFCGKRFKIKYACLDAMELHR
jgi:hypothetical protein